MSNHNFIDLTGHKFNRLTVLRKNGKNKFKQIMWACKCDCGSKCDIAGYRLRDGTTQSCGCLKRELTSNRSKTHGMSKTLIYKIWGEMIRRCTVPTDSSYHRYGDKGITVCSRWLTSFESFYADMGERPSPKHSIDRINNLAGYSPGNCRWATSIEQANNTSIQHYFVARSPIGRWYVNKSQSIFAREYGLFQSNISKVLLNKRKHTHGWQFYML